jgi:Spy/CpxP family protein refolding chaperone
MRKMLAGLMLVAIAVGVSVAQERMPGPPGMGGPGHEMRGGHGEFPRMGGPEMGGHGAWWKNSELAKELNLTDAQQKQLEKTFMDHRMKLVDLNADLERQELKLEPLISADSVDENAVSSQLDQVIAARGRLEKSNAMMFVSMRKVLSQDQWKKLQGLHRMRRPMGMRGSDEMRGPGGMERRRAPRPDSPGAPNTPQAAPTPPPGGPSEDM